MTTAGIPHYSFRRPIPDTTIPRIMRSRAEVGDQAFVAIQPVSPTRPSPGSAGNRPSWSKNCRMWRKGGHEEETIVASRRMRSGHHGTGMVRERSRLRRVESPVRTIVRAGGSLQIIAIL